MEKSEGIPVLTAMQVVTILLEKPLPAKPTVVNVIAVQLNTLPSMRILRARSLPDLGVRREADGSVRTNCHDFEAHSGPCATRNRGDLGRAPTTELESA